MGQTPTNLDLISAVEKAAYDLRQDWLLLRLLLYEANEKQIKLPKEKIKNYLREIVDFFTDKETS